MLSKWCLTSGCFIFYGLKPQGLFALDVDLQIFCLATCPRSAEHWHQDHAKPEWSRQPFRLTRRKRCAVVDCFYFAMRAYKNNIEVDWSSHLFVVEMKNKMQMRHKGAQEIQRQSKGAGQSNVTTEFWSQLFPGFPRFQRKSSNQYHPLAIKKRLVQSSLWGLSSPRVKA